MANAPLGTALPMPKQPTLTEQESHALIVKEACYRIGCADCTPVFTLRRAEPDTGGRYPRANWDVDKVEGAEAWPPEYAEAFREAVLRNRGKYDIVWAR